MIECEIAPHVLEPLSDPQPDLAPKLVAPFAQVVMHILGIDEQHLARCLLHGILIVADDFQ